MPKIKRDIIQTQKLAEILGITDRRIQQLVTEGILKKEGRGKYDLVESVQTYISYTVDRIKARQATGTLAEEQTRLTKLKADKEELEIEILRGDTIPIEKVVDLWGKLVASARTRLIGLPSAVKTRHPDLDMAVFTTIEDIIRTTLEELSRNAVPDRYRKNMDTDNPPVDAAAKTKPK